MMTYQETSRICGISSESVSFYATGRSTPSLEDIVAIAKGLGVSTDYLLGTSNYRPPKNMNRTKYSWR